MSDIETMRMEAEARLGVPALEAEARRLREIIEGRTTPPTDEEIHAHRQVGAGWMVSTPRGRGPAGPQFVDHSEARDGGAPHGSLWWPLDADGRPCAWPTVPA